MPAVPLRVLVADDSAAMRTMARFTLSSRAGFRVVAEATNGSDALALFDLHRPDCVVLDVEMPGMGGFEALEELQRRSPEVPVVLLSGHSDDAVRERAFAQGAAAYVDKSDGMGTLAQVVRRLVTDADENRSAPPTPRASAEPSATAESVKPAESPEPAGPTDPAAEIAVLTAELRRLEYVVSHDFAEPLRIMKGFATLLQSRYAVALDGAGLLFTEHIAAGAARMQAMVDDLLGYSRAGVREQRPEALDLRAQVDDVLASMDESLTSCGATVEVGELPTVRCDPDALTTVLRHLVHNAILFRRSQPPHVQITGRSDGAAAVLEVSDNGMGIPEAQRGEVLQLFRRLNTREEYPGTGTGLALCVRMLAQNDGSITIGASPSGGTTATVTLPTGNDHREETP